MNEMNGKPVKDHPEPKDHKLGVFSGVFTPSILTILGLILFLRMGYTVGHAGLGKVLVLITIANLVSVLTTMSLSAIATNIQVKGGGAYYLISRTLGVQFGGAIGLVLFLAQSISIAFYCVGFAEALLTFLPPVPFVSSSSIAAVSVVLLFLFAWLGADWATKFQYVVMALLALALVSFFAGGLMHWDSGLIRQNFWASEGGLPFWVLFAVFFPAVTGFTQGVNMSGDLKDPGRAIPLGTFLAVGLSMVVYYLVAILLSGTVPNAELMVDYAIMKKVALVPGLISAGMLAATLSSAMASFLGAPRILQSIAKDKIFKILNPFAKGEGGADNPRRGVLLSGVIALATISLGQLNLIAQVVSMFFLISYALINYATFYESRTQSPSFRPRFRWFNPWLSLAGFITCAGAILAIDIQSGIMAVFILLAVYQYLKQKRGLARWADSRRSHYLKQIKENLNAAAAEVEHDRDWRPFILAFTRDSKRLKSILGFSGWLEGGSGMTAAVRLVMGQGIKTKRQQVKAFQELSVQIKEINSTAYPLVVPVFDISQALPIIIQSFGLGPLKANTVLINWMDELGKGIPGIDASRYAENLRIAYREGVNIVVLNADDHRWQKIEAQKPKERCIDVWWKNDAASRLMLLLAYLVTRHITWSGAAIRVLSCETDGGRDVEHNELMKLMEDIRIDADPVIVPDDSVRTIIEMSAGTTLVFLPCRIRENQVLDANGGSLMKLLPYLPMTALVMAAQDIDLEAEPDTGAQGELAQAEDDVTQSTAKYEAAMKESLQLQAKTEALTAQLVNHPKESDEFTVILKSADLALEDEEIAFRKVAKAKAKVEHAKKKLESLINGMGAGKGTNRQD
ncbi:solute carrier family protein [Desulforapulum autotrophicum HRM2]|uniref:Solute carrier family protein n=2 Tax=Desulforapulum autotrophicum TaxID=2296 RepID=C0QL82_DESAH|nr:solute carrier family protein [Desulforapulum autotrophicum HRM2]